MHLPSSHSWAGSATTSFVNCNWHARAHRQSFGQGLRLGSYTMVGTECFQVCSRCRHAVQALELSGHQYHVGWVLWFIADPMLL